MTLSLADCRRTVLRLVETVRALEAKSAELELAGLDGREWYELLTRKLIPQLGDDSFLVVAVVGGTNIGKSVVFNHIAGFRASATSPLASGTKHPTVLLPPGFREQHDLQAIFPEFVILPWDRPEQALAEDERHLLFWREHPDSPDNLLILDTPDIDSVARINWERADHIRQSADVLVAVLTQQKYNDAAVKEFFRKAAQEDKLALVVFNQVLLPEDEDYWPIWLDTFRTETGIQPHAVYLAPNDRRAAESMQLPFYERAAGQQHSPADTNGQPRSLLSDLSDLRFGEIKLQTLTGSLRHLADANLGIPDWLGEIRRRSSEFRDAQTLLSSHQLAEVDRWPTVPNRVLIQHIRQWWSSQREGWAANVHGFYNRLGEAITAPVMYLWNRSNPPVEPPLQTYRRQEWTAILDAIERVFQKLTWIHSLDNPLLAPRLEGILAGNSRAGFLEKLKSLHDATDFDRELDDLVGKHLASFREESPEHFKLFKRIDTVAAAGRPALSVLLFMTGAGPVGDALIPVVTDGAIQSMLHLAGDAVGGTLVTAVGDKVISEGAATGAGYLELKFRQLHAAFVQQRSRWLVDRLREQVFGTLPAELAQAANVALSTEFQQVERVLDDLKNSIASLSADNLTTIPAVHEG